MVITGSEFLLASLSGTSVDIQCVNLGFHNQEFCSSGTGTSHSKEFRTLCLNTIRIQEVKEADDGEYVCDGNQ